MDEIDKPCLLFRREMELMRHIGSTKLKTMLQIGSICRNPIQIFRINGKNDPLMFLLIDLCQIVTFKLVDQKNVPIADIIKVIIDQKLFSPGN